MEVKMEGQRRGVAVAKQESERERGRGMRVGFYSAFGSGVRVCVNATD
jgi:hypothetical protein